MTLRSINASLLSYLGAIAVAVLATTATAQELSEPVYRVAKDTPATQVSASSLVSEAASSEVATVAAASAADFFDIERAPKEHPFAPCKRLAERCIEHIDTNVPDYSCTFSKMERIDGKLQSVQHMHMQTMHEPFSIYLRFIKPKKGQECLYVDGVNENRLVARAHGWRGKMTGQLNLEPTGSLAMDGQKYPITKAGIRNLCEEVVKICENDMKFGECEVKNFMDVKMDGRPAVMIEATHPVPRRNFRFHKARIYVDKEYRIPVRFEAYKWPKEKGGKPPLEELYVYTNLKFENGYTDADFTATNPEFFK